MLSRSTCVAAVARRLMSSGCCNPLGLPPLLRPYGFKLEGVFEYDENECGGETFGELDMDVGADRDILGGGIIWAIDEPGVIAPLCTAEATAC